MWTAFKLRDATLAYFRAIFRTEGEALEAVGPTGTGLQKLLLDDLTSFTCYDGRVKPEKSMSDLTHSQPKTPRERFRAQIRDEIKQIALRQLAELGPAGVSVNAIGKELGVSGPALYRYYASRDDLLTELTIDAYDDLAAALRTAIATTPNRTPHARFDALARAYRAWAIAQPHRYRLLYGPPLPGYDAHARRLIDAASASMDLLVEVLPTDRGGTRPTRALATQASDWAADRGVQADAAKAVRALLTWSRLHGFVSLEIAGNYASMGIDPDALFEIELSALKK
jgi:AcrR family transcriptional regulator